MFSERFRVFQENSFKKEKYETVKKWKCEKRYHKVSYTSLSSISIA